MVEAAGEDRPVAEACEARAGEVRSADLQRDEVDAERERDRHEHEVEHPAPVHREELVVLVVRDDLHARPCELGAHDEREQAREQEEPEGGREEARRDHLVVGRRRPFERPEAHTPLQRNGRHVAFTVKPMPACCRPQNSAQRPTYVPGRSKVRSNSVQRCGNASRLKRSDGIQNEWMTSREMIRKRIVRPGLHDESRVVQVVRP